MSKKTRSEKEIARLRRDLELLRGQIKHQERPNTLNGEVTASKAQSETVLRPAANLIKKSGIGLDYLTAHDFSHLNKDLFRTGLLSLLSLLIIFAIYQIQIFFPATINLILRP